MDFDVRPTHPPGCQHRQMIKSVRTASLLALPQYPKHETGTSRLEGGVVLGVGGTTTSEDSVEGSPNSRTTTGYTRNFQHFPLFLVCP